MEKQQLKTQSVIDGVMLQGEEINYCGLCDYCMVDYYHTALTTLLQHFVGETMEDGVMWSTDIQAGVYAAFDVLADVSKFKEDYLKRRVVQLEAALDLKHNGDIGTLADITGDPDDDTAAGGSTAA
jgi:hypothetical protein